MLNTLTITFQQDSGYAVSNCDFFMNYFNFIGIMERKTHTSNIKTITNSNYLLKRGYYGFKLLSDIRLTKNQIISLERLLLEKIKKLITPSKRCKFWTSISLNKTLTKQPLESRMGKGKGSISTKAVFLKRGFIIYEFTNISFQQARHILFFLKKYLPNKLFLITKK